MIRQTENVRFLTVSCLICWYKVIIGLSRSSAVLALALLSSQIIYGGSAASPASEDCNSVAQGIHQVGTILDSLTGNEIADYVLLEDTLDKTIAERQCALETIIRISRDSAWFSGYDERANSAVFWFRANEYEFGFSWERQRALLRLPYVKVDK